MLLMAARPAPDPGGPPAPGDAIGPTTGPDREVDDLTLRLAIRGDAVALGRVVAHYHPTVHALVWRMCAGTDPASVDDLVQDALLRTCRGLARFDPAGPARPSTWILTITTRVVLNHRRRTPSLPLDAAPEPRAPSHHGADHGVDRATLARAIGAAVATLGDDQRAVLVLREFHELDYAAIADALDLDVGTVKSRLARARAQVRAELTRRLPDHLAAQFGGTP